MGRKFVQEFIYCVCGCGELRPKYDNDGRAHKYIYGHYRPKAPSEETRIKISLNRKGKHAGDKHWNWKGGIGLHSHGYLRIHTVDGRLLMHRLVYEEYYKCCLLPWSNIHHKNQNKLDNRIENLEAMMNNEHTTRHKTKNMSDRRCYNCNSSTTELYKNSPQWYKHKEINGEFICKKCYRKLRRLLQYSSCNTGL